MKKHLLKLLFFISIIGYSQNATIGDLESGARKVTFVNPSAIVVTGIKETNSTVTNPISGNPANGIIEFTITGGTPSGSGYNVSLKNGTTEIITVANFSQTFVASNSYKCIITGLDEGTYNATVTDSKGCSPSPQPSFIIYKPLPIQVNTIPGFTIPCFGDKGTLTPDPNSITQGAPYNGTPTYYYEWYKLTSGTFNKISQTTLNAVNLLKGTYKLVVTDFYGNVGESPSVIVTENPQIAVTPTITNALCKGGTGKISLAILNAEAPYTITWTQINSTAVITDGGKTLEELSGTFKYTITDKNTCTISGFVAINEPTSNLVVTHTSKQPTLTNNNGEIALTAIGGTIFGNTPAYNYVWSKVGDASFTSTNVSQRTDLGNGTYNIIVTSSSGCVFPTITVKIEALNIEFGQQTNIKCFGASSGSITVNGVGGTITTKYDYIWFKNGVEMPGEITNTITGISAGTYRVEVRDDFDMVDKTYIISTEPLAALSASHTFTNVVCNGESNGTITLDIQGGITPYTVVWKNALTGDVVSDPTKLPQGTYSYLITDDNGCTFPSPQNITIKQNEAIKIVSITQKQPTLFSATDGEITINASEGTGAYTYILKKNTVVTEYTSSPITGLGEGVYEVSVKDANKCTTAIQTITLKALAVAFVNKTDVTCNGANTGSIEVLATGGTSTTQNPYTYKWSYKEKEIDTYTELTGKTTNKIENLYAGFYKVLVTDNAGISRELEIAELTERPAITCTITKTDVKCFNGSDATITLSIQGGTGDYHVLWNDGVTTKDRTGIPLGDYSFSITDDNGCSYSSTPIPVKITQPLKPLLIVSSNKVEATGYGLENGSISIVVSDGTFPYTYQWYKGAAKTLMTGETNSSLTGIGADTYTVVVTDKNLCPIDATYTILQPAQLLITAINETESIKCFGYKEAVLKATISGGAPIGVADADKNYIYKWYNELNPSVTVSTTNPTEALIAGNYFLEVSDGFGNSYTSNKVIVKEPTPVKINFTQTNVSCKNQQDGSIHITTSGGTGIHTITWSKTSDADPNSISNLFAGNYSVTVRDANNCTATQNFVITEPEVLAINKVVKTPPSGQGVDDASIAVTVQGGTPNYNFQWYDQNMNLIYTDNNKASNTSIYNIYAGQYFISVTDANGCSIVARDLDKVDPLFINVVQINTVQCHGDATASIKALTSGGLPGYYYKWYEVNNPSVIVSQAETLINAKAGTYYVIATDSFDKSIQSQNITITEPTLLTNSLSAEYVRCGDGNDWTIVSNASEGSAPYTYLWNTGAKTPNLIGVVPGNYSLVVTDKNGCTINKSINITAPAHLDASENIKIPTCYAGSDATIVVTTIAGTAPYTYLWNTGETSNTLSNAKAGTYSIEIKDAKGCIISRTYTIVDPPKDVIDLGEDVTLCFDQTLTINATIADNQATYSWTSDKGFKSTNAMITVSEPANYTVIVTNKLGCEATDTIKISSQNTAISAEFAVSSQAFLNEKIIIVDISNPIPDTVEWILPAGATVVSKDKDYAEISFNQLGEHDITIITTKGNCVATQTKTVMVTEGEYENPDNTDSQKKFDLKIYPNPSDGKFTVDVTLDKIMPGHIKVYSLSNNQVIDSKYEEGKDNYSFNFSLNGLPSGVYFVLFESQQGTKLRKIIIK